MVNFFFNFSRRTNNLVYRSKNLEFFGERVRNYWNKLQEHIKSKNSVNSFKNALDAFRENGIKNEVKGQFWELSNEIFLRI